MIIGRTLRIAVSAGLAAALAVGIVVVVTSSGGAAMACPSEKKASANLKDTAGDRIGRVEFWDDSTCVTRVVVDIGQCCIGPDNPLTPGFHGFHFHSVGKCEADATDTEGNSSPFFTAGTHWNPGDKDHGVHKGDLPPLLATSEGLAGAAFLTDRFTPKKLFDEDGSAVIVHQAADNLAHIPATTTDGGERYHSHAYDSYGPDEDTLKTGDGGARFACGVVKRSKG
jgi:superoxide dismutase, Cu-Zn family